MKQSTNVSSEKLEEFVQQVKWIKEEINYGDR